MIRRSAYLHSKRGMTLFEIVITIAVAAVVLGMVGGITSVVYAAKVKNDIDSDRQAELSELHSQFTATLSQVDFEKYTLSIEGGLLVATNSQTGTMYAQMGLQNGHILAYNYDVIAEYITKVEFDITNPHLIKARVYYTTRSRGESIDMYFDRTSV